MSIWSALAADPSAWVDPQALAAMPKSGTGDSLQGSELDNWGVPSLTYGASTPEEMVRAGLDPNDPLLAEMQRNYGAAYQDWINNMGREGYQGPATPPPEPFEEWLKAKGLRKLVRRVPGTNNAEVGYFDANGNQVGQSIGRHASEETDFLAGAALLAAPALTAVAGAGAGAGATGSSAAGGGLLSQAELASLAASPMSIAPEALLPGTIPSAAGAGAAGTAAAAGGLSGLASSAGNALSKLATPGNLLQAGATLGGALIGSTSADRALQAQQQATNAALAEQRRQYDQTRTDLYGARDFARQDLQAGQQQSRMDLLSGRDWARNDLRRGQQQAADYLNQGLAGSRVDLNQGLKGALADYAPYQQAGQQALSQYQQQLGRPVTAADVVQDPGYAFGLQQGQQALDRKIAAMGGRVSGSALKAATRYGTDYASTGYNAAYQRRQDSLNRLAQLAGMGQQAAGQAASARLGTADRLSNAGLSTGQGLATGALGTAGTMAQTGYTTGQALSSGALNTAGQLASGQFQAAGGAANAGMNRANAISDLYSGQGNAAGGAMLAQGSIWANAGNQLAALYGRRQQNP